MVGQNSFRIPTSPEELRSLVIYLFADQGLKIKYEESRITGAEVKASASLLKAFVVPYAQFSHPHLSFINAGGPNPESRAASDY